jgi:hypothetical protein
VLAGYHARYGGSIYPFLYLLLAALFFSPGYRGPRWVAASILLVFSLATFVQSARTVRLGWARHSMIATERALHDSLRTLPQDGRTVYIVNAPPSSYSAARHISRAWSLNLNLVIVNQFRGCTTSSDAGSTHFLGSSANPLVVRIPGCAAFFFHVVRPEILRGVAIRREGVGTYRPLGGPTDSLLFAKAFTLELDRKETNVTFLGYDWDSRNYKVVTPRD